MALKKKPQANFEDTSDVAVVDSPAESVTETTQEAPVTTEVAVAANTQVALAKPAQEAALANLKDLFVVDYDTFPRLVGGAGNIEDGEGNDLGDSVTMMVVSWQNEYAIVPGDQSDEAKAHLRYSSDGVTIDSTGESCVDYLNKLKDELGYERAKMNHRVVLVGVLTDSSKKSDLIGETVQVNLSPTSRKTWERYCFGRTIKAKMGTLPLDGAENIRITAQRKTAGTNKYTMLNVTEA